MYCIYVLHRAGARDAGNAYATDVVCGMQVRKAEAPARLTYGRQTFYFCSDRCREKVSANPAKFADQTNRPVIEQMS